jgi:L-lysine 2,3-aminomutase
MRERLSGYLLPRLVREIPGKASKTPVQTEGLQLVDIS